MGQISTDGIWKCYVGKAPAGIAKRLQYHAGKEGWSEWSRALLICKDTTYGFTSTQTGWLEGRLYDQLVAAEYARLENKQRPSDETLPPYEQPALERVLHPVTSMLRLIGYDPTTADDDEEQNAEVLSCATGKKSRFFGVSVSHLIEAGLLKPDSKLVSMNGAWPAVATVQFDGTIQFDSVAYPSPSKAASSAKDGKAANGWEFWAIEEDNGRVTLATLRARYLDSKESTTTAEIDD